MTLKGYLGSNMPWYAISFFSLNMLQKVKKSTTLNFRRDYQDTNIIFAIHL